MESVKNILDGWRNHLFPPSKLKDFIQETSNNRLAICVSCEKNSTPGVMKVFSRCKECGCPLMQKSKSLNSSCPLDKWGPVASDEENHEVNLAIKNGKQSD